MYLRPAALRCLASSHSLLRSQIPSQSPLITARLFPAASASQPSLARMASTSHQPDAVQPQQIYYGTLTPKIRAVKVFSLTTSIVGLAVQPMLVEQGTKLGGMPMVVFLCGFAGIFTFITPLLLHFITKKYVTQIAYDAAKNEYEATTISFLLLKKKVGQTKNAIEFNK